MITYVAVVPVTKVVAVGATAKGIAPKVTLVFSTCGVADESVNVIVPLALPLPGTCSAVIVTSVPLTTTDTILGKLLAAL